MQLDTVVITGLLPTRAARVYGAWLDDREHTSFTGGQQTKIDSKVGGAIEATTYSGKLVKLRTGTCIGFTFRTPEFPEEQPDSRVEVQLSEREDGTSSIEITHSQVPAALAPIMESLWLDRYLTPMRMYFASLPELPGDGEKKSEPVSAEPDAPSKAKERKPASSARKAAAKKSSATKSATRAAGSRRDAKPAAAKPVPKKKAAAKKSPAKKSRSRSA